MLVQTLLLNKPQRSFLNYSLSKQFVDPFYATLVLELNLAFGYGLWRPTLVLYRTLLENLLVDLLRGKLVSADVGIFFDEHRAKFLDLSVLITNLRTKLSDFKPYSARFDQDLIRRLNEYRETANASSHILDLVLSRDYFTDRKEDMGRICDLLVSTVEKITSRNL